MKYVAALLVIFLIPPVFGATLEGNVYDFSLTIADNSIVELSTIPATTTQRIVASDGLFSFEVSSGTYQIIATHGSEAAVETITITADGTYVLDLILLENLDDLDAILQEIDEDIVSENVPEDDQDYAFYYALGILLLFIVLGALWTWKSRRKKTVIQQVTPEDDLPQQVLEVIKKEGGRTTQKQIRKHFHWSEAKISLVITELEHHGKIKKIKKGRGNIILLT
jgi:uncharacterized membrane protein